MSTSIRASAPGSSPKSCSRQAAAQGDVACSTPTSSATSTWLQRSCSRTGQRVREDAGDHHVATKAMAAHVRASADGNASRPACMPPAVAACLHMLRRVNKLEHHLALACPGRQLAAVDGGVRARRAAQPPALAIPLRPEERRAERAQQAHGRRAERCQLRQQARQQAAIVLVVEVAGQREGHIGQLALPGVRVQVATDRGDLGRGRHVGRPAHGRGRSALALATGWPSTGNTPVQLALSI